MRLRPAILAILVLPLAKAEDPISFSRQIRPILSENCIACHGPDDKARKAKLRLDDEASAKSDRKGDIAIVPGKPELSLLIQRIESKDPEEVMPPPKQHKVISPEQVALLKTWIRQGAHWGKHWSYEPVETVKVPANGEANPIDAFLFERLKKEKLNFSPPADRSLLVRRTALDLTGLPPTPDELTRFAQATPTELVDYYLAQPTFGEHWARGWLDMARYADSAGYPSDPGRSIWPYRDWVIRAFNSNQRFDRFSVEQLAGDLLPTPTQDQLIATAFHRNTMTQNEGGTSDEEFRTAAVIDRVNTTYAVWMGTTMACAQCHTHKYDPITITEYFRSYALFNQSADSDKADERPTMEVIPREQKVTRDALQQRLTQADAVLAQTKPAWLTGFDAWLNTKAAIPEKKLAALFAAPKDKRTAAQVKQLQDYYVRNVAPETKTERESAAQLRKQLAEFKPPTVPVMQELPEAKQRKTFVQLRGNWQALGDEVTAGVPVAWHTAPTKASLDRLGFAEWLVSPKNPLTARVQVNRLWETVFGVGIVRSSEEFGSQGDLPVHPELLDWLAGEYVRSGWDTKHILRLMFTSRAYRQSSASKPTLNERDPDNRLLARGPRFRPSGELLRDQALAVAGLLSTKMYGAPVRPIRPASGLTAAFGGSNDWTTSAGEDAHRRSVYTDTRRNSPYPSFTTFDAPNRETCTLRRDRSNTPLQAFVTLNDPVFVEASQGLARRLLKEGPADTAGRLQLAFRLCVARAADAQEIKALETLLQRSLATYRADPALATKMATQPLGPADKGADLAELAAWTAVAGVMMNLDEFLMRR
ncbi:chromosome segregation protein [Verrucomicrobiota bacterium]|nr:chromosome segregation protein [Verrucomicrobiota bacterium]